MTSYVLVHGVGAASPVWDAVRPSLGPNAIAVDLPGHGARAHEPALDDVGAMADDVARSARTAFDGPVVVVGHSMGGAVAQAMLARHTDVVARVVLVSSALRFPAAATMCAAFDADAAAFRALFKDALGTDATAPRSRALVDTCGDAAFRADLIACAGFDARAWAAADLAAGPVVVVGGDLDEITPPVAWRRLASAWSARLVAVGPHGHVLQETCPVDVVNAARWAS